MSAPPYQLTVDGLAPSFDIVVTAEVGEVERAAPSKRTALTFHVGDADCRFIQRILAEAGIYFSGGGLVSDCAFGADAVVGAVTWVGSEVTPHSLRRLRANGLLPKLKA